MPEKQNNKDSTSQLVSPGRDESTDSIADDGEAVSGEFVEPDNESPAQQSLYIRQIHRGPLPPADDFERYEDACEGAGK